MSIRPLSVFVALSAAALLAGCDVRERATRTEIYQLAFRAGQMQEALERCEPDAERTRSHAAAWQDAFEEVDGWLEITAEEIENRMAAGREALAADGDVGCAAVARIAPQSVALAQRWGQRIAEQRPCGWFACD